MKKYSVKYDTKYTNAEVLCNSKKTLHTLLKKLIAQDAFPIVIKIRKDKNIKSNQS